jgi:hypothetical protein
MGVEYQASLASPRRRARQAESLSDVVVVELRVQPYDLRQRPVQTESLAQGSTPRPRCRVPSAAWRISAAMFPQ